MVSDQELVVAVETLVYRDRLGQLRIRARWTRSSDGKQMEVDEGGVYTDVDAFTIGTIFPLLQRIMGRH
jgi:hypothetical protein